MPNACRALARVAWGAAACIVSGAVSAQQITAAFGGTDSGGSRLSVTFTCTGTPTCTGTYVAVSIDAPGGCTNPQVTTDAMVLQGLDLSATGPIHFTGTFSNAESGDTNNPDGTCSITPGSQSDAQVTFDGQWDGTVASLAATALDRQGRISQFEGGFTASGVNIKPLQPPPFQMQVTSDINATTASASAVVQFDAGDVGKSIYVFAYAPRSLVKSAVRRKDGADNSCVLAQPDPSTGQLTGQLPSTLRAAGNVQTAQGQSVTILQNASTPANAGASYFVGVGSDPGSMITSGANQGAVAIPGSQQCPSVFPANPQALSGLWYDAAESGWGIHFTQRGVHVFGAWFTYDGSGNPKWYVSPDCTMASANATSGPCTGTLYQVSGPLFFGAAFDHSLESVQQAGTLQVDFADPSHASMTYTVSGVSRTVSITRQVFRDSGTPPAIDYTDLWYNPNESGWGMAVSHEFDVMFLAWFVYDGSGKPIWYVAPDCAVTGQGCSGALYQVAGPPFGPTFDPAAVHANAVGTVNVQFTDPNDGIINYTVNGVTSSKAITRQVF
ncbi:MAG TPA: hypothetical protein VLY46_01165 [Usitatibacter sp.]|nr:hypothetical protein [Usitatibacter sp.]